MNHSHDDGLPPSAEELRVAVEEDGSQALQEKIDALQEEMQRLMADWSNDRKQRERDMQTKLLYANQRLIEEILPVIDAMDMALSFSQESSEAKSWGAGFEQTRELLLGVLKSQGLVRLAPKASEVFHADHHEAVAVHASSEAQDQTVARLVRAGYLLHGRVLRPAQVEVYRASHS